MRRSPRIVYELEDLLGEPIDGQFYAEITPVKITTKIEYLVDKILDLGVESGNHENLVR